MESGDTAHGRLDPPVPIQPPRPAGSEARRPAGHRAESADQAAIMASAVSSMRFEKPHSLSYQAQTLTKVPPVTLVSVAS